MSALQSNHANSFSAHLALAAGVSVSISAPTLADLSKVVARLQDGPAANDAGSGTTAGGLRGATHEQSSRPVDPATGNKASKPAATPAPSAAPAEAGNASASTGTPASAPAAASGSEASAGEAKVTYDDVRDRVLKLAKVSRETATGLLAKFTGQNGQPCDHANKMKLEDYASFVAQADEILKAAK